MSGANQFGRSTLPPEQERAIRGAVRWEIFTIVYTAITIAVIALVVGNSQAMRTAWIEDMLSLIPQFAFLIALIFVRRRPTRKHPYGMHRAMGVGHLVAGVALLAVGVNLAIEAITGLLAADHPTIGTIVLFGHTIWLGWLMVSVMAVVIIGPVFFYGPAKSKLAPVLHNKLLYADADMAKPTGRPRSPRSSAYSGSARACGGWMARRPCSSRSGSSGTASATPRRPSSI